MVTTVAAFLTRLAASIHPDTAADLQALHDRMAAAGLSVWLVRHQWGVAMAIASSGCGGVATGAVLRVLAGLRGDGFDWAEAAPGIVRVGRSGDTGRWVEVEHWNVGAHSVTCARANSLTREQFDVADVEPVTVELFGRRWPTLAGMFAQSATDISVTNSLYHYYALLSGRAVPHESARACYIDTTSRQGLGMLAGLSVRHDADFFCLNDGSEPEVDEIYRATAVSNFLARYYPHPAPWELEQTGQCGQPDDVSRCAA